MPLDPAPSRYRITADAASLGEDLVAVGGDLEPGTLLAAYRQGLFPMPLDSRAPLAWWSPDPRGVLPLEELRVSRSLRASLRRFRVTVDSAFGEVVRACADPRRPGGWITPEFRRAYQRLHELGWAHSVEVWAGDELVGGLYGVAIGGLFAGESMFHRARDASKVALVRLVGLLLDSARPHQRVLDVQWRTDHLASLGAVEVSREEYLRRLDLALPLPLPAPFDDGRRGPAPPHVR